MTAQSIGNFFQSEAHDAHTLRRQFYSAFNGRGGVVPATTGFTDLKVTQRGAGANMSVDVAEGTCYVTGTESNYQGLYHCDNQGVTNVVIGAANPTNPRRDLIVARIKDTEYGVAVTSAFTIEAIAGTPAGSPADPTVPANCIVLARVAVAAAASSITNANITDLRNNYAAVTGSSLIGNQQIATALGGVTPCLSTARPTIAIYPGEIIWETDTGRFQVWTGSSWTPMTGVGTLGSRIGCEVYSTAAQSLTGSAWTDLTMNSELFDSDSFHSTSSNTHRVTIPTGMSGTYAVTGYFEASVATFTANCQLGINKSGDRIMRKSFLNPLDSVSWTGYLAAGDWVSLSFYHSTSTANSVPASASTNGPASPSLTVYKVA